MQLSVARLEALFVLNQAALRGGALTVPGPRPGMQWNLEVALLEIAAVSGVDNLRVQFVLG